MESLNAMRLDVSSVGNHEFDEGATELLRMQNGGCHPVDGCYFDEPSYAGADFPWLAANVVNEGRQPILLPGTGSRRSTASRSASSAMTLEATPTLVAPAGVRAVDFKDEVETANAQADLLKKQGVKSIVALHARGRLQLRHLQRSARASPDPIATIAKTIHPEIDPIVTGHTHEPYVCSIPDPAGNPRLVTSAASYGQSVTETSLVINTRSGEVDRGRSTATNHLVPKSLPDDPAQNAIIGKWMVLARPLQSLVIGNHTEPITGDSSTCRCTETPMGDLVADAILDNTKSLGAQVGLMNVGGVRASLNKISYGEAEGQITYAEAFDIAPFGNVYVALNLTGAQLKEVLEQQYQPIPARGSRPMLALGVSDGFSYTWDATQPQGSRVVPGSMTLDGNPIGDTDTVRVGTLNFLADGGDSFTAFKGGTNAVGGIGDLEGLVAYFKSHPDLKAPADRVSGL